MSISGHDKMLLGRKSLIARKMMTNRLITDHLNF